MKLFLIFYQRWISPLLGPRCRFHPSCSTYALESYRSHSFFQATYYVLQRLLKCHPFHPGGVDLPRKAA